MTLMTLINRVLSDWTLFGLVWCAFMLGLYVFLNTYSPSFYRLRFIPGDALLLMGLCAVVGRLTSLLTT